MKNFFIYLFCTLTILVACDKLELPTDKEEDKEENPDGPVTPPTEGDTISVAEAMTMDTEDFVLIKGYMVGYVKGTSIKTGANFGLPDYENTNFLLADHPDEVDPGKCIAVKLEKTGKFACRSELNLLDHPEFLRKEIIMEGLISMYFGKPGITRIFYCEIFIENDENNEDNDNSSENGNNGNGEDGENSDNEENGENNDTADTDSIGIDDNEQIVPDGRNFKKRLHFSCKTFGTLK